jgi:hypothetical protein
LGRRKEKYQTGEGYRKNYKEEDERNNGRVE